MMMKLILLGMALALAGASPVMVDQACGPHTRPWQVHLHGDGLSCSGALINEWWLVTSFSCNVRPYSSIASLGEHDMVVAEGTEQHLLVADVIKHSPYRSPFHSLTMVRLARPARLSPYVQPIPLPNRCPQPGESCRVSGWRYPYPPRGALECMEVPVVDDQTCMDSLPDYLHWSYGMVCAGTDNCMHGTSNVLECGGQLQGLMWFQLGCEDPASPSVYTKMCIYTAWIQDVMERYTPPPPTQTPGPAGPAGPAAAVASDADGGLE